MCRYCFYVFSKKIVFFKICLFCCCLMNVSSVSWADNVAKYYAKNDISQITNDVKIEAERVKKKVKRAKKHPDWNDWHGLGNKKNIKNSSRYSQDEILENELKHYEIARQNLLIASQRRNHDKRHHQQPDAPSEQIKLQKKEKIKIDNDVKKANEKYLLYKDNIRQNNQKHHNGEYAEKDDNLEKVNDKYLSRKDMMEINRKYRNGEYTNVIATNTKNAAHEQTDDENEKEDIDAEEDE